MIRSSSEQFKALFLLNFTKELIKHSHQGEILSLQGEVEEKEFEKEKSELNLNSRQGADNFQRLKQIQTNSISDFSNKLVNQKTAVEIKPKPFVPMQKISPPVPTRKLLVPEPNLPPELAYLKPSPTATELELGKLQSLINDPLVQSIECSGEDEQLVVHGNMGSKSTNIILSKEEINDVIEEFSKKSRIPVQEGIFKVAVGRLVLSAVVSNVISSKFIIKKMIYNPFQQIRR